MGMTIEQARNLDNFLYNYYVLKKMAQTDLQIHTRAHHVILRYSGPLNATSSTSQSGEASTSNQPQKNRQNTGDPSASLPFISHGHVSSTESNRDLERSLQMA